MDSEGELSVCFSDVLTKFRSVSGLNFKLKKEQDTALKGLLLNQDVRVRSFPDWIWDVANVCETYAPVSLLNKE